MPDKTYSEPARNIPVAGEYDVLVCGGGTSGIPAAVSAGREGMKVALIERYGFLGGVPAMNIMVCWHGLNQHHSGLLTEWARRIPEITPGPDPFAANHMEPEAVKLLALEMIEGAGVELHLHTMIVGAIKEGNVVKGIITESKSGRQAFLAKQVIDATGDGDVAAFAGAEYRMGDDEGRIQGMTVRFRLGCIDFKEYFDWIAAHRQFYKLTDETYAATRQRALAGEDFYLGADLAPLYREHSEYKHLPLASYFNCSSIRPGELSCNATRVELLDGTREVDLTKAEIGCRRQIKELHDFLRHYVGGFARSRLIETAPQIGVRETRSVVADYILTEDDCRRGVRFEDSICQGHVSFDLHNPGKYSNESLPNKHYVPYRCLLTKGLENLMVIGRAMSADHVANSTARQMYKVFTIGEVAGLAAALAVQNGITTRQLPYGDLKTKMIERKILFD
jgi:hypothetical protein